MDLKARAQLVEADGRILKELAPEAHLAWFGIIQCGVVHLKKIADSPSDITPTISMGITIDHMVAMSLPVLSGFIWQTFGFRWVFLLAGAIALAGFFVFQ